MKFTLQRITPPTEQVMTLAEGRAQLRVDTFGSPPVSDEDDIIQSIVTAVTQELDAGTGWLGRALAPQSWALSLTGGFPSGRCKIRLPYPPLITLDAFSYTATDGTTVTMVDGTDYRLFNNGDEAFLVPPFGENWPTAIDDYDSVVVYYSCGYVAVGSPQRAEVPELIKQYAKAALTELYDTRGVSQNSLIQTGQTLPRLAYTLNGLRVWDNTP